VQPDYKTLAAQGVTVALSADDPDLANQVARARANGMNPAIWIPATSGSDPTAYGQKMAGIVQKYGPSSIIPNVEADGKGGPGSKGYNWSDQMMAEYSKYVPQGKGPPLSVSVMGEDDFNYDPYLKYGGDVQVETFGSKLTDQKDVDALHARLLARGIPEDKITMLLAPGQSAQGWTGKTAGYTLDDMSPQQYAQFQSHAGSAGQVYPGASTADAQPEGPSVYTNEPSHVPDAQNPRAVAYAKQRLAQLQKQGYSPSDYGITGDPTAQWRAMSAIVYKKPPAEAPQNVRPSGMTPQQQAIIASVNPGSQHVRTAGTVMARPQLPQPRPAAPMQPHQMPPLTPEMQRVGPMQQAIQVAAAMRTLRQLRPSNGTAKAV
jgi:hypothetical protein